MKKTICTLLLLAGACLGVSAQNINNGGFENWRTTSFGQVPTGMAWVTSDSLLDFLGASAMGSLVKVDGAVEPANVHGGTAAVGFKTIRSYVPLAGDTVNVAGILLLGDFDFTTQDFSPVPFSGHPTMLTGYYKLPANGMGDYLLVNAEFRDGTGTIGTLEDGLNVEGANYKSFSLPISWSTSADADSIMLSFELTNDTADNHMGSSAYLDDIAFSYPSGIKENLGASTFLKCYPNPAVSVLYVENTGKETLTVSIVDVSGKEYLRKTVGVQKEQLDVSGLTNGIYFYQFRNSKGETVYGGKVAIRH